jgi:transcriptional regulator with XRE-family HTH domain
VAIDLFAELGFDADDPQVVAAREDATELVNLIESLTSIRRDLGIRQVDIADRMGTTQSAVSDIERLGGDPRLTTIQRYARALGARVRCRVDATGCNAEWKNVDVCVTDHMAWVPAAEVPRWDLGRPVTAPRAS